MLPVHFFALFHNKSPYYNLSNAHVTTGKPKERFQHFQNPSNKRNFGARQFDDINGTAPNNEIPTPTHFTTRHTSTTLSMSVPDAGPHVTICELGQLAMFNLTLLLLITTHSQPAMTDIYYESTCDPSSTTNPCQFPDIFNPTASMAVPEVGSHATIGMPEFLLPLPQYYMLNAF